MGEREARGPEYQMISPEERREQNILWFGFLGGPLAFLLNLQTNYMLVDWACLNGHRVVLYLVPLLYMAITVFAGLAANKTRLRFAGEESEQRARVWERSKFMGEVGLMLDALVLLAIIAQWIATFFIDPCQS